MASDGLAKIKSKKSRLVGKLHCKPKTLLGELGSTLKDFLTTSFARDSSRRSTNADIQSNGCKEDEITVETTTTTTTTVVEVLQTDDAGTGDGPRIQKLCSELVEISVKATREDIKVESLLEEFGSTLKDFLATPFVRAISEQSTNADPNDYTVEKKRPELNTVEEVLPAAVAVTGDGPGIEDDEEGPSSNLTDFSVKATTEGIKVELDFFDLLLFARSFSAKTSEAASHPCSVTGGFQHGYVLAPQLFNLCNTPHNLLRKTPTADHYLYLDDLQLFIEFSPTLTPDSIDHLRVVTQYCSW